MESNILATDGIKTLIPELTPFLVYYIALIVRILDSKHLFWSSYVYGINPECLYHDNLEDCNARLENPLAKSHHEFIFINIATTIVTLYNFHYSPDAGNLSFEFALGYLLYTFFISVVGLRINWSGVDSLFASLYAMSATYGVLFTLYGFWEVNYKFIIDMPLPVALTLIHAILATIFQGIHFLAKRKNRARTEISE